MHFVELCLKVAWKRQCAEYNGLSFDSHWLELICSINLLAAILATDLFPGTVLLGLKLFTPEGQSLHRYVCLPSWGIPTFFWRTVYLWEVYIPVISLAFFIVAPMLRNNLGRKHEDHLVYLGFANYTC